MDLIQGLILGATIFDYWFDKIIIIYCFYLMTKLVKAAIEALKTIAEDRYE